MCAKGHTRMVGYLEWIKSTFGHKKGDTQPMTWVLSCAESGMRSRVENLVSEGKFI